MSFNGSLRGGDKPRVCIVAHYAFGAMTGGKNGHVGGVERQTTLTARWLAARGYEVSLLTWNEGQPWDLIMDGVRVISICKYSQGIPGVRFLHPRMTGLFSAMRRADADIYYHNCSEYVTGLVAWWCKRNKRKFVYSSAHDYDCDSALPHMHKAYERRLYKFGIFSADRLIVQTDIQKDLLLKSFGLESITLPMPCPGPDRGDFVAREFPLDPRVLWVGRAVTQKRPDWLLDIAERVPEVKFDIAAANISDSPYVSAVIARAKGMKNVNWMGPVERDRMPELYKRSLCLCSTSIREGFPNTFLEAWSHGTPLITTFDPDRIVAQKGMGRVVHNVTQAAEAIRELARSEKLWREMSSNARRHYEDNNMVDTAIERFEQQFLSVCAASISPERFEPNDATPTVQT